LLDAYALVAFLVGGTAAPHVRSILRAGDAGVATVNLAEALDVSQRVAGLPIPRATELLEPLLESTLVPLPLGTEVARRAAEIRSAHYHRSRCPISLADAVLLASARAGDSIATADPDVLAVAAATGIGVVTLPGE
jgi:predicted nucleic acid-binding protein